MATEVKLPRLGQGMESGTIVRWLKREGDQVRRNEPLYELDTDKVTQEVEAEADGVLLKILVADGDVEVGTTVAMIGTEGDDATTAETAPEPAAAEAVPEPAAVEPAASVEAAPAAATPPAAAPVPSPNGTPGGRIKASPLARRIARERGVALEQVVGTGPDGRVVAQDVENAAAGTTAGGPVPSAPEPAPTGEAAGVPSHVPALEAEVIPLTSVRRTIARRLSEAWQAPVFQLGVSVDVSEALRVREALVARTAEGEPKPTVNDLLVKIVAVTLLRHPAINATFADDAVHRHPTANVGMAVAAPAGLVVPVVRSAERLTVPEVARVRADLVGRARDGKLALPDLSDGTFTISNLGMFGIEQFTAVLNPPQVAILAVGAIRDEAVVVAGAVEVAPIMRLTLTCDHRAIDGADGAQFLQTLVELIQQPALAL